MTKAKDCLGKITWKILKVSDKDIRTRRLANIVLMYFYFLLNEFFCYHSVQTCNELKMLKINNNDTWKTSIEIVQVSAFANFEKNQLINSFIANL